MNRFRQYFKQRHTFLPVIHAASRPQVLRNVELAVYNGADGVFLTNHIGTSVDELIEYYHAARERYPDAWIGLKMQGVSNRDALGHLPETECPLWTDNAGFSDGSDADALEFEQFRRLTNWRGLYFGGIGCMYQSALLNPGETARRASRFMDVVMTSGARAGVPPSVDRVSIMRRALGPDTPLAIASGMTHRNVHEYADADCYMVSSSLLVEGSFNEFDELKLLRFANKLSDMNRQQALAS